MIQGAGVGVSGNVNSYGEIDLSKDLDASKLPDVVKEAYKAGAEQKLKGVKLQTFVVRHLSQSIRDYFHSGSQWRWNHRSHFSNS